LVLYLHYVYNAVTLTSNYLADQIKKNEMGGECSMQWTRRVACRVVVEKPERKRGLDDLGVDWEIMLKFIFKKWDEGAWTALIWLRTVRWQAVMNVVMNFCFP
jgi:hypothetical protein